MDKIEIVEGSIQLLKMDDTEYFSEKYSNYVSNSKLGLLNPEEGGSPEKFLSGFKSAYSESFELGSAVHAMVLQPETYHISNIRKPTAKLGIFAQEVLFARKAGYKIADSLKIASIKADYYASGFGPTRVKAAIKGALPFYLKRNKVNDTYAQNHIYLSTPMYEKYIACMTGVMNNDKIGDILAPEYEDAEIFNEYAILCELDITINDVVTRVKVKAKLDNFTINHTTEEITLNDLKTTGKTSKFFMGNWVKELNEDEEEVKRWYKGSFENYHYYRQMGMYLWLLQGYIKAQFGYLYKYKANILVVETIPNYNTRICSINGNHINKGLEEFKKLMLEYARISKII
jgi:hypothetical protein